VKAYNILYASLAEVLTMISGACFSNSSGAEEALLSESKSNELLIINLATVPAEGILFPHLLQAVKRYLQAKRDTLQTY
jgi:hypothetical protein